MGARWTIIGVAVLVGLLGLAGAASGQDSMTVVEGEVDETPESLPGTYHASLTVRVKNPEVCLCRTTHVTLALTDAPWVEDVTFEPESYTIDWAEHAAAEHSMTKHTQPVELTFTAPASLAGEPARKATIVVNATHEPSESPQKAQPSATQLAVTFPGEESEDPEATSEEDDERLETNSEEGTNGTPAVGPLVAVGVVGTLALLRRRRGR